MGHDGLRWRNDAESSTSPSLNIHQNDIRSSSRPGTGSATSTSGDLLAREAKRNTRPNAGTSGDSRSPSRGRSRKGQQQLNGSRSSSRREQSNRSHSGTNDRSLRIPRKPVPGTSANPTLAASSQVAETSVLQPRGGNGSDRSVSRESSRSTRRRRRSGDGTEVSSLRSSSGSSEGSRATVIYGANDSTNSLQTIRTTLRDVESGAQPVPVPEGVNTRPVQTDGVPLRVGDVIHTIATAPRVPYELEELDSEWQTIDTTKRLHKHYEENGILGRIPGLTRTEKAIQDSVAQKMEEVDNSSAVNRTTQIDGTKNLLQETNTYVVSSHTGTSSTESSQDGAGSDPRSGESTSSVNSSRLVFGTNRAEGVVDSVDRQGEYKGKKKGKGKNRAEDLQLDALGTIPEENNASNLENVEILKAPEGPALGRYYAFNPPEGTRRAAQLNLSLRMASSSGTGYRDSTSPDDSTANLQHIKNQRSAGPNTAATVAVKADPTVSKQTLTQESFESGIPPRSQTFAEMFKDPKGSARTWDAMGDFSKLGKSIINPLRSIFTHPTASTNTGTGQLATGNAPKSHSAVGQPLAQFSSKVVENPYNQSQDSVIAPIAVLGASPQPSGSRSGNRVSERRPPTGLYQSSLLPDSTQGTRNPQQYFQPFRPAQRRPPGVNVENLVEAGADYYNIPFLTAARPAQSLSSVSSLKSSIASGSVETHRKVHPNLHRHSFAPVHDSLGVDSLAAVIVNPWDPDPARDGNISRPESPNNDEFSEAGTVSPISRSGTLSERPLPSVYSSEQAPVNPDDESWRSSTRNI